jgi:bifunctional non-homologous end joining protein LigD
VAKESASKILSIDGQEVQITNPEKLYLSSQIRVTKLELVQYYLSVAPGALAGIQDRPIVLKRFVNGAEAEAFYQKRTREAAILVAHGYFVVPFRPHRRRNRGR